MQDRPLILCADDDPTILAVLRNILEGARYQVVTAENGIKALNLARTSSVDLAILDVNMPGKSGIEVLAELKAHDAGIDIIMVSSVENIGITLQAMGQGALASIADWSHRTVTRAPCQRSRGSRSSLLTINVAPDFGLSRWK